MRYVLFLPPWGMQLLSAIAIALVFLAAFRSWRERAARGLRIRWPAFILRILIVAGLIAVALNPTALYPKDTVAKPRLIVLIDTSASMATRDVDGEGRLEAVLTVLREAVARGSLEEHFTLDVRCFDKDVRPAILRALGPEAAKGRASDIGGAIASAVGDLADDKEQAGILIASDGRATALGAEEAARLALARSIPLWTWCVGGDVLRRDVWLDVPASEILAFSGDEVELGATLHQLGFPPRTFVVEVLGDEKVIARIEVTPDADGRAPLVHRIAAPDRGEKRFTFRVAADPDEAETANNERSVHVRAVGDKVRILVVEGQPHWDAKFLVQALKRSPRVDLTALYRLGDRRRFAVISSGGEERRETEDLFPRTPEAFAAFDVIVMGRGCEAFFDAGTEDLLSEFVARQAGGLIFSRGKGYGGEFRPLAKLEPVVWGAGIAHDVKLVPAVAREEFPVFEIAPTGELDALIDRLPRFDHVAQTAGIKPLALVLARGGAGAPEGTGADDAILLATQLYGLGRVVTVNASGLWRWAFRIKGRDEDEFVYDRLWLGLLRWLISGREFLAEEDVSLRSDRRLYSDDQTLRFLIHTRRLDPSVYRPRLSIRGPGEAMEIEPGRQAGGTYVAEAGPFAPGTYEVRLANNIGRPPELTTTVEVVGGSIEHRVLSADPAAMARLAEISDGEVVRAEDVAAMDRVIRTWHVRKQLAERKDSLWDRWPVLAAILALLAAEWFVRRRGGLL